jgi:serine/threonine protein kinase
LLQEIELMNPAGEIPILFDHYQVERVLGNGAMGTVYLARDVRLGRLVALKTLHARRQLNHEPDSVSAFERFRREAQLCSALIHPNIVTLYDAGYEDQRFTYLAMEYVDGESLQSLIRRVKKLEVAAALKITYDILQGLSYAHSHGIIHRDVKPANIMVSTNGTAKIADFGVATSSKLIAGELTEKGQLLGTPHYMAPEQISGKEIDQRADLFSVGVIVYEMISGIKPFSGSGLTDVLFDVVNRPERPLEEVSDAPPWCATYVARLLKKSPDDRFASAADAGRELRYLLNENVLQNSDDPIPVLLSIERERTPDETPTTPIRVEYPEPAPTARLNRPISLPIASSVIVAMLLLTGGGIYALQRQVAAEKPTPAHSAEQLAEFERKEAELREASLLYDVGAYEESMRRYDGYLARYPNSSAALEGRARAEDALERQTRSSSPRIVEGRRTGSSSKAAVKRGGKSEKDVGWWRRIRNWFRREAK